ncbi:ABC transporter substrate-binding protein [Paenibacillus sp. ACRRX]|uniref:ABC transporter substrate-binding protein n=1 Tax=Paenibacillus sp. ACRRX TaxID=2918206 RepID=UPI001EF6C6EA|nr:ABC transporter substrate-binding protein [Paenibacillus sp. ACRRX]MCG7410161.1 ABC transporter substrate-binding protein [Paenibacillus sp. ACRRX]
MKRLLFFLLVVCLMTQAACSNEHHAITVDEQGYPELKGRHLVAYVAAREEVGSALLSSFCQRTGCTYEYIRLSTEEILRRVSKEALKPQADLVIGGTVDAHLTMKQEKLSSPINSANLTAIPAALKDEDRYWAGYEVEQLSIAINEERWRKEFQPMGLSLPTAWEDLLHPAYRGSLVMPDPNYSGTAYTFLLSLYEAWGERRASDYVRKLNDNIGSLTVNGYMPAQSVSAGEYVIGINFLGDQRKLREAGFDLLSSVPKDTGLSVNAISKLRHAPNEGVADWFIDYSLSQDAAAILEHVSFGTPTVQRDKIARLNTKVVPIHHSLTQHEQIIQLWNRLRAAKKG